MRTIFKFPLSVTHTQTIEMPQGAIILSAQAQQEQICIWAEVNSGMPFKSRTIEIIGTGHPIEQNNHRVFISTVQVGPFVWHVYERTTNN